MVLSPKMPNLKGLKSENAIQKAIDKATAVVEFHKKEAAIAAACKKVLRDKQRSIVRGRVRAALKAKKKATKTATANRKTKKVEKKGRGRPSKLPGHCLACCYRFCRKGGGFYSLKESV